MNLVLSMKQTFILIIALNAAFISSCSTQQTANPSEGIELTASEQLGKALFFDARLSSPVGQSCASCHSPQHGFSHPNQQSATSEGAQKGIFGNRNAPSIAYIKHNPEFHTVIEDGEALHIGGFFIDGREKTLENQAIKPLLNPVEMGLANEAELIQKIKDSGYEKKFNALYGSDALSNEKAIQNVSRAIADYQRSSELSPFNSKYDAYLKAKVQLSAEEKRGLELFNAEDKGNCAACHISEKDKNSGFPPLFTDYTYDNLGVPANKKNPFLNNPHKFNAAGKAYVDNGLGDILKGEEGKFKVPTLRNIALTAPYMHNGVFKTLEEVVDFYNTRDTDKKWGKAEVSINVNKDELGDLHLSKDEVNAIVAFLQTLNDGYSVSH